MTSNLSVRLNEAEAMEAIRLASGRILSAANGDDPRLRNLITVYNMLRRGYRSIPINGLLLVGSEWRSVKGHESGVAGD